MADSDKNIVITPQTSQTSDPTIEFKSGATSGDPITLNVTDDGTTSSLSFEGSAGQLFSISNDLTGTIFGVADGSGIPIIEADADGDVRISEFGGQVQINNIPFGDGGTGASSNVAIGENALGLATGSQNVAIGANALSNATSSYNTAVGDFAGCVITSGTFNIAIGQAAMSGSTPNSSGVANIGIGTFALDNSTWGSYNTALGYRSLENNTSGEYGVAIGLNTLRNNTTGGKNVAIGYYSLCSTQTGACNIAIGNLAGRYSVASDNIYIGTCAGACMQGANQFENIAIGYRSSYGLPGATLGCCNITLGSYSAYSLKNGNCNVVIGQRQAYNLYGGARNVSIGSAGGNPSGGTCNVSIGYATHFDLEEGYNNVAIGHKAGYCATRPPVGQGGCTFQSGIGMVHIGAFAGAYDTGGSSIAIGDFALGGFPVKTGRYNVAISRFSLYSMTTGYSNIGIGSGALSCVCTSCSANAFGYGAGYYGASGCSTLVGFNAGCGIGLQNSACINASPRNTLVGYEAGIGGTGNFNTAVGHYSSGFNWGTPGGNTSVGAWALYRQTGNNNTAVGYLAACLGTTGANNTTLGYNAQLSSATASNEFTLGDANISNLRCNDTTISGLSDERDKTDIVDLDWGLDFIEDMRPVKFSWNRRDHTFKGKVDIGFIAQELDLIEEKYSSQDYTRIVHKEDPERLEADTLKTYPIAIKALKELSQRLKNIETQLGITNP